MKMFLSFLLFLFALKSAAQGEVVARINNIRNNDGICRICLFNSAASFNADGGLPVQCQAVTIKNNVAAVAFNNLQPGTYAMAVFHDANANGAMDKSFLGIPKEGYGASRNKLPFASAPRFDENKFVVSNLRITTLNIRLRNL